MLEKKQGHPAGSVPVSAYGGISKKLKNLRTTHCRSSVARSTGVLSILIN